MSYLHPPALQAGKTIGVIAPSGPTDSNELEPALAYLERRGYHVRRGKSLYARYGFLAGTDTARAADFNEMFSDPDVHAVFCSRGGYGACRILDHIDWSLPRKYPKVFCGYSDITTLHLALEHHAELVSFHSPMVSRLANGLNPLAEDCFWRMLESPTPYGEYSVEVASLSTLQGGKVSGPLMGGCLSLLSAAAGTPESPDFTGAIMLIEDVNEANYRVDRMLMQLHRSGVLERVAGFVIGDVTGDREETPSDHITLQDIWRQRIASLGKPTVVGFPFGHVANPLTIPLGCLAELDADACRLTVTEASVR